jgi:hypothetical protein
LPKSFTPAAFTSGRVWVGNREAQPAIGERRESWDLL